MLKTYPINTIKEISTASIFKGGTKYLDIMILDYSFAEETDTYRDNTWLVI